MVGVFLNHFDSNGKNFAVHQKHGARFRIG
nr:MAG TPA: hypothetical protein [Bacteriophage sp.]